VGRELPIVLDAPQQVCGISQACEVRGKQGKRHFGAERRWEDIEGG